MAQLMFRCPYTNKPIRSGIELVPDNLKAVSEYPISVHCPHAAPSITASSPTAA